MHFKRMLAHEVRIKPKKSPRFLIAQSTTPENSLKIGDLDIYSVSEHVTVKANRF